jgi:anti-sigma factor RsiW
MNCKKVIRLLSDHVDGNLSGRVTWEVDRHLAECNRCTEVANELRKTVAVTQTAVRFDAPPDFGVCLRERLAACPPAPKRQPLLDGIRMALRPRTLPAWAATAAVVVLMVAARDTIHITPPVAGHPDEPVAVRTASDEHIALTASGPLDDISASVLESHYALDYDGAHSIDAQ